MPYSSSIFLFWWERQTDDYRPAQHDRFRWGNAATRAVDAEAVAGAVDSPRWFNFRIAPLRTQAASGSNQSRFDYFGWQ